MIVICFGGINSANISHKAAGVFAESRCATCARQREINQSGTVDPSVYYAPGERLEAHRTDLARHPV